MFLKGSLLVDLIQGRLCNALGNITVNEQGAIIHRLKIYDLRANPKSDCDLLKRNLKINRSILTSVVE